MTYPRGGFERHRLWLPSLLLVIFAACSGPSKSAFDLRITAADSLTTTPLNNYYLFAYRDSLSADLYHHLRTRALAGDSIDYLALRLAYSQTGEYSPYDRFPPLALKEAMNREDYQQAAFLLDSLQNESFAKVRFHYYAGYVFTQLGDISRSDQHLRHYQGLIMSILESGDGRGPQTAFFVIDTEEEYDLFRFLGLQSSRQSLMGVDGYRFDVLEASAGDDSENNEIWFNIDLAFRTWSD
jgi:hypothetical protein